MSEQQRTSKQLIGWQSCNRSALTSPYPQSMAHQPASKSVPGGPCLGSCAEQLQAQLHILCRQVQIIRLVQAQRHAALWQANNQTYRSEHVEKLPFCDGERLNQPLNTQPADDAHHALEVLLLENAKLTAKIEQYQQQLTTCTVPEEYLCPITFEVMEEPVIAEDGHTYEREAIAAWLSGSQTSPLTRARIATQLIPNRMAKSMIGRWKLAMSVEQGVAQGVVEQPGPRLAAARAAPDLRPSTSMRTTRRCNSLFGSQFADGGDG